jgi:hypothetical protein
MIHRTYSVAISADVHAVASRHLLRTDGQEDLCFALWYPSAGRARTSALVPRLVLPHDGDRLVHGNASFLPQYFERAISEASAEGAGLAFMHSHPGGRGWQGMSDDDVRAEHGHAAAALAATSLPLVGLTIAGDGSWSARIWERMRPRVYGRQWCANVRVVGHQLAVTYHEGSVPRPRFRQNLQRTVSAWGEATQADLARLRIGIVGAGSVGALIAEAFARTGIQHVALIDFDAVEMVNLDRLLHATEKDVEAHRAKVAMLADALPRSATAERFQVEPFEFSVCEEEGFRAALDCDLLFSCVDRPWARSVLNFIAYAHLIPVVDGGIAVALTKRRTLRGADWRAHVAASGRRCLACIGQYDPGLVSAEREGYLDNPAYIQRLPEDHPVRRNENVFAFSMATASLQALQALSMVVAPLGIANTGEQMYHFTTGRLDVEQPRGCEDGCPYPQLTARGDRTGLVVTAVHPKAEDARRARASAHKTPSGTRRKGWLTRLLRL